MNSINDCYTLNNGTSLPCFGFGTYNEKDGDNLEIIRTAIRTGYRFFDTASIYETERVLGQAIKESGIPREDFFIESKLWIDEMGYENAKRAFEATLDRLQMDYLDLYLIHWPRQTGDENENWKELDLETWRALEDLHAEGKIRSLGCSNFLPHHLDNLLSGCKIKPVVDQLELHPGYSQEAAVSYLLAHDIRPMAWSPLGRGRENALAGNALLAKLAKKYQKSIPQINLRFLLQKGIIPIPKASTAAHMKSNMDIFDFSISEEDMWIMTCMPQTTWLGEHPDFYIPTRKSNPEQ